MSNFILCHTNRINAAILGNGVWEASLPLNNLKDENIDMVTRSAGTDPTQTRFYADLGVNRSIRVVNFANHNLRSTATWRVKAGTVAPNASNVFTSGQVYDSGVLNAKQMSFSWDEPSNWGKKYNLNHAFNEINARYVTVDIFDNGHPALFIEIGRCFIGTGFQPTVNAQYGLKDGMDDLSTFVRSESGKKFFNKKPLKMRWADFVVQHLTLAEGDKTHDLDMLVGLTEEIVYIPDPADAAKTQRYGFLGTMRELSALEYPLFDQRSKAYRLEQKM